jgi:hypothetical protein
MVHVIDASANPAVTLARGFTTAFAGVAINHVPVLSLLSLPVLFVGAAVSAVLRAKDSDH